MTPNKDLVIIYDADCPMCRWYTGKFVQHNLLAENGREPYQQIGPYTKTKIDMQKAKNHIALLNKSTGEVTYGYHSLVAILGSRWKWIKTLATTKIVAPVIGGIYNFISFNRKVIAPAPGRGYLDCIPEKSWVLRSLFMLFCLLIVEFTAGIYFSQWFTQFTRFNDIPLRESWLFISQIGFQALMALIAGEKRLYDYQGHVALVSAFGGLLLLPLHGGLLFMQAWGYDTTFLATAGLGAVLMAMFMEHKRRVGMMGYKKALSYTWVLFRIALFFVIFKVK